jgi:hypothetical protein
MDSKTKPLFVPPTCAVRPLGVVADADATDNAVPVRGDTPDVLMSSSNNSIRIAVAVGGDCASADSTASAPVLSR